MHNGGAPSLVLAHFYFFHACLTPLSFPSEEGLDDPFMALAKGAPCVASLRRPGQSRRKTRSFNLGNNLRVRLTHHGMGHPSAAAVARDGRQQK